MDGFVFFRLSYSGNSNLQLFAIFMFEVDFSETYLMTSPENNISQPPNSKIFWARPPYKARAFGTRDIAPPPPPLTPVTKKLATTLASPGQKVFQHRIAFPADTNTYPICDSSLYKSPSVADPRGPRSFLYLDQTEARRAERNYLRPSPPPPPTPVRFQLCISCKVCFQKFG